MAELPQWFRRVSCSRLPLAVLVLMLLAVGMPAGAQSPVAVLPAGQPDIKLIHLYEHTCPAGVDPRVGTLTEAAQACPQSIPNVNFTLSSQASGFQAQLHPTNSSSDTEWHEIPSGAAWSIQQAVPQGYGAAVVRCQMNQSFDPALPYQELTFAAPGGRLDVGTSDLSLTTYVDVSCYWFDIPAAVVDTAAAPQAQEVAQEDPTPIPTPSRLDTGAAPQAQEVAQADETPASTPTVEIATDTQLAPDTVASPGVLVAAPGGVRLDIRAWSCPFHAATKGASVDALYQMCNSPNRDANFIINNDPTSQAYTDSIGAVSYPSVPQGTVTITYLGSNNTYDSARVFCYTQDAAAPHLPLDASKESPFSVVNGGNVVVTLQVQLGQAIDCVWFNQLVTTNTAGSVLGQSYTCPMGTNTSTGGLNELLAACQTPHAGVQFVIANTFFSSSSTTDSAGRIAFVNYGPGPFSLTQAGPLDSKPARVFCRAYNADDWDHVVDPYGEYAMTGNAIAVQLRAHWELDCIWFDSAGDNFAYLDVTAYACPANFAVMATTPRRTYAQQCTIPVDGATFRVTTPSGFDKTSTSANGSAFFQEHVPGLTLAIAQTAPPVYRLFGSFCGRAPFVGIGAIPSVWTPFGESTIVNVVPAVKDQAVCEFYYKPISIAQGAETSSESQGQDSGESADAGVGTVRATLLACPGTTVNRSQCGMSEGPATLHFEPVSAESSAFDLEIGRDGAGQAEASGAYVLTGFPVGTCLVESDGFDGRGQLMVPVDGVVDVRVYRCGG